MLRGAARRFSIILLSLFAVSAIPAALIGLAAGASLLRSMSVGFYIVGALLLTGTVVMGVRGPLRPEYRTDHSAGAGRMFAPRMIRKATADERWTAQRSALLLFTLGLILIAIGTLLDPVHRSV